MKIYTAQGLLKPATFYTFGVSVSASPGASVNDYAPTGFGAGTNRLLITAAAGGTTITGLNASGIADGVSIALFNDSDTDNLTLPNNNAGSLAANRFLGAGASDLILPPRSGVLLVRVGSSWRFL